MNADSTKSSASAQGNNPASMAAHCNGTRPCSFKLAHRNDEYLRHATRVQVANMSWWNGNQGVVQELTVTPWETPARRALRSRSHSSTCAPTVEDCGAWQPPESPSQLRRATGSGAPVAEAMACQRRWRQVVRGAQLRPPQGQACPSRGILAVPAMFVVGKPLRTSHW